jgi:hypothetical protein
MAAHGTAPLTAATVEQGREDDHAEGLINSHHSRRLASLQEKHLQRRYLLPAPIARAVAEIHFGRAAA